MVTVEIDNTSTRIHGLPPQLWEPLDSATRYPTEMAHAQAGGWKPPEAATGEDYWDGWKHLSRPQRDGSILVPTGLLDTVHWVMNIGQVRPIWLDRRKRPMEGVPHREAISLRPYQKAAVEAALRCGRGVLDMPPRAGKTRTGLEIHRSISLNTIWIAPSTNIVTQTWRAAELFFGKNYACVLKGTKDVEAVMNVPLMICTAATAAMLPQSFWDTREVLFIDEIHHAAAATYHAFLKRAPHIFYRFGMSGTFFRSGNDDLALYGTLSNVIFHISAEELVKQGFLVPADVVMIPVEGPRAKGSAGTTFSDGVGRSGIYEHEYRNRLAAWVACTLWSRRKNVLILVGTKKQGYFLVEELRKYIFRVPGCGFEAVEFVSTDKPPSICQAMIDSFVERRGVQVLIGTSMVGEGTDLPSADALVYAPGGKAEVMHAQATYRVCTAVAGKSRAVIVDFADRHNDTLLNHAKERVATYFKQAIFKTRVLDNAQMFPAWADGLVTL